MKFAIIIAALCIGLGAAHTQEEIERKGREIMEEYRRDRGHWIFLNSQGMVDHMVDHIGANGLAFAGFFISKKHYRDAEVRSLGACFLPGCFPPASHHTLTLLLIQRRKPHCTSQNSRARRPR